MIVRPEDLDQEPVKSSGLVVSPDQVQPYQPSSDQPTNIKFDPLEFINNAIQKGPQNIDIVKQPSVSSIQNPSALQFQVLGKIFQEAITRGLGGIHGLTSAAVPVTGDNGDLNIPATAGASTLKGILEPESVPLPGAQFQKAYPNLHWALSGSLGSALDILPLLLGGKTTTKDLTLNENIGSVKTPDVGAELRDLAKSNPEQFQERFQEELQKRMNPENLATAEKTATEIKTHPEIQKIFEDLPQPKETITVKPEEIQPIKEQAPIAVKPEEITPEEVNGYKIKYFDTKPKDYYGKHFSDKKEIHIYTKGRTIEQIKDTLDHELGHVFDYERRGIVADPMGDSVMGHDGQLRPAADHDIYFRQTFKLKEAENIRKEVPKTHTAGMTQKEIYADAYKLFKREPDKLKAIAPSIYKEIFDHAEKKAQKPISEPKIQKVLIKSSGPQVHTVVRELPREKGDLPEEKYYEVKNDRTGKSSVVESADIKNILSNEKGSVNIAMFPGIEHAATLTKEAINILSPKTFVPRDTLDTIMKKKGELDKIEFELESKLRDIEMMMDKWPKEVQVGFIDNIKRGQPQGTPELQTIADMMRKVEDNYHAEAEKYKPGLAYKENHYRVLWKEIPGSKQAKSKAGFKGLFRRPLQGSKGFTKQSTLQDMSEGIEKGGVPYSYNPMTMWRNSLIDMQKFITSQRMWKAFKDTHQVKFVKNGQDAPDGFVRLNDRIAKVYFPTDQGLVNTGEFFIEENAGRVLNNFLSRDLLKESSIGGSLLKLKNITTAIELSISPFHAAFESIEAMSSSIGLGLQKIYNRGVLQANPGAFLSGISDILFSPVSPATTAHLGGKAIRFMSKENFLNTAEGKSFIKEFPNAKDLLDDLFTGGGKLAIHQDYKINSLKAFKEGIKNKEPWAVAWSAIPAINETLMKPLFEIYIPRLKVGFFLREYSNELLQRQKQLASGKLSRPQLARQVWDSVENRFGEMNFDNLFWDRTFKSAMQLMFRSVTWKLGSLKNIGGALPQQLDEIISEAKEGRAPLLHRNVAWLLGLSAIVATFSTLIMGLYLKQKPKDFRDLIAPRYDEEGNRISINSYLKDIIHIAHSPVKYVTSSLSGQFGRTVDIFNNKDFFGTEIYHPDDPAIKKMTDSLKYLFPTPFSISNFQRISELQAPPEIKASTLIGMTQPSPGYITHTKAEEVALKILKDNMPVGARTLEQYQDSKFKSQLRIGYDKTGDRKPIVEAIRKDRISPYDAVDIINNRGQSLLKRLTKHMSYGQVSKIMDVAEKDELQDLKKIFVIKIVNKLKSTNDPKEIEMAMASKDKIFKKYKF